MNVKSAFMKAILLKSVMTGIISILRRQIAIPLKWIIIG